MGPPVVTEITRLTSSTQIIAISSTELAVNLKAAKTIGLVLPPSPLQRTVR